MEAVLGAMFLDGGIEPVRQFVRQRVTAQAQPKKLAKRNWRSGAALGNYKSALQEHLQGARLGAPVYKVVRVRAAPTTASAFWWRCGSEARF